MVRGSRVRRNSLPAVLTVCLVESVELEVAVWTNKAVYDPMYDLDAFFVNRDVNICIVTSRLN